jgi:hypothetical protein
MNTIREVIAAADKAAQMAEAAGITVAHVAVATVLGARLHPEDTALTPALAESLGLTERHVAHGIDAAGPVEFFDGEIDGVRVSTHWVLPVEAVTP